MASETVKTIKDVERPQSGTFRHTVHCTDGSTFETIPGAQVNYMIENSENRQGPVVLTLNARGQIRHVRPAEPGDLDKPTHEWVIQGKYGPDLEWEEVSAYPDTNEGHADALRDRAQYNIAHPYAQHRVRRVRATD